MGSRRSRLTILLALFVATAAACVAYLAVANSNADGDGGAAAIAAPTTIPTEAVLVAKQDIPAATTLTADMIDVRQVQPDARSPRALTKLEQAVGMLTAVALTAGEQILDTRLTDQPIPEQSYTRDIPVGMRAITLVFDQVQGVAGLVQPGDHVDVIAYFEFKVKDFTAGSTSTDGESDGGDENAGTDESDGADENNSSDENNGTDDVVVRVEVPAAETPDVEYKQYVSVYVVQNVEVFSVDQALTPGDVGVGEREPEQSATEGEAATDAEAADPDSPKARPDAKSITLLVTPEQAERLLLASQTVTDKRQERDAALRLVARTPGDTTIYDLPPAQLGTIPLGGLLGDVNLPLTPTEVVITDVQFTKRVVNSGEVLEFRATVKNVSDRTIRSDADVPPEYVYTQGIAYDELGFFAQPDTYRIGLNVAGASPTAFPYRWGIGRDLAPGESTTIVGSVQLTEPVPDARYWLGVIQEPNVVTQDGVGVVNVTVLASEFVTVKTPAAELVAAPEPGAELVRTVTTGERLDVLGVRGAWYRVRAGDAEGWIAAGAIEAEPTPLEGETIPAEQTTRESIGRFFEHWSP